MPKIFHKTKDVTYSSDGKFIYAEMGGDRIKLALFDGHYYKLKLYNGIPVLEIDGLRMHLVKDFKTPLDYAREIVKEMKIKKGAVLDSCMGLGYTAIEASKKADSVITCEISRAVIDLAQWNPFSDRLFKGDIVVMNGSIADLIKDFKPATFSYVIHDPPRFSHAPELYSKEFHRQLFRVCKKGARIFHYVGSVGAKKGRNIEKEVEKRLKESGFRDISYSKRLQGLFASK